MFDLDWCEEECMLIDTIPGGWAIRGRNDCGADMRGVPSSWLSLVLPGPLGCNAHGLRQRVRERMAEWTNTTECTMPDWFYAALGRASREHEGNPWLSRYLVMTDALAAARGWPTGPGAPVYEWKKYANSWAIFGAVNGSDRLYSDGSWACDTDDPMAALAAVWLEATHE